MIKAEVLQQLDDVAQQANSLWHSLERLKRTLANEWGFTDAALEELGVWLPYSTPHETEKVEK